MKLSSLFLTYTLQHVAESFLMGIPRHSFKSQHSLQLFSTENDVESNASQDTKKKKKSICVVGAGWGGWGAAKALCEATVDKDDYEIILLDALPDPTGQTPYLSKSGKPVEAGTRGFWMVRLVYYFICNENFNCEVALNYLTRQYEIPLSNTGLSKYQ
jgi:hypothetical protein